MTSWIYIGGKRFSIIGFLFACIQILSFQNTYSQLFINEFVASNSTGGYYDALYRDYPDWIEIYNYSDEAIDIGNYYLTDDLNDANKWNVFCLLPMETTH